MIEYKFNKNYNIIVLKRKNGLFEYYLEKIGFGSLAFMFYGETEPSDLEKSYFQGFIKNYENQKFWGRRLRG